MLKNASLEVFPPQLSWSPVLATLLLDDTTSGPYPFAPQAAVRSTKGEAYDTHVAQAREEKLEGGEVDCPLDSCPDNEGLGVFFAVDLECVLLKYRRWHDCFPRIKPFYGKSLEEEIVDCRTLEDGLMFDNRSINQLINMKCAIVPRCSPIVLLQQRACDLREFFEEQNLAPKICLAKDKKNPSNIGVGCCDWPASLSRSHTNLDIPRPEKIPSHAEVEKLKYFGVSVAWKKLNGRRWGSEGFE